MMKKLKNTFKTGLIIVLPAILTIWIIGFIIDFLTNPFISLTTNLLNEFSFFQFPSSPALQSALITIISKISILLFIFAIILLIGIYAEYFLIDFILKIGGYLFNKTPFVNKIYKPIQEVVHSLFSSSSRKFSEVTLIPFFDETTSSIGLIANKKLTIAKNNQKEEITAVFIPATPNPTYGFLVMTDQKNLKPTEISIDEAMKYVLSCGVSCPSIKKKQNDED
jgi:uncharacterized membrane protein